VIAKDSGGLWTIAKALRGKRGNMKDREPKRIIPEGEIEIGDGIGLLCKCRACGEIFKKSLKGRLSYTENGVITAADIQFRFVGSYLYPHVHEDGNAYFGGIVGIYGVKL
jgi:hypothetical protein